MNLGENANWTTTVTWRVSLKVQGQDIAVDAGQWHKFLSLTQDTTTVTVLAADEAGEMSMQTVDIKYDTLPPLASASYATAKFRDEDTHKVTYRPLDHPATQGEQLVIGRDTLHLGTVPLSEPSLDSAGIPYIAVDVNDQPSTHSTPADQLDAHYRVFIDGIVHVDKGQIPALNGSYYLPLTIEYLSEGVLMAQGDDTLLVEMTFSDKAGNKVEITYSSLVYLDLSKVMIRAPGLNANTILASRFEAGPSGILNQCVVVKQSCQVAFPDSDENLMLNVENTRYEEPYNGRVLSTTLPMRGLVTYRGESMETAFSPITLILMGFFEAEISQGSNFEVAMATAIEYFESTFGFDPTSTVPELPAGQAQLTDGLKLYALLEAISVAAYERKGYFDEEVNSVALAYAGYLDLLDGIADSRNDEAPVAIDGISYSYEILLTEAGKRLVDIAWIKMPDHKDSVADYATSFYTPLVPAIQYDVPSGPVKGLLRIDPSFDGEQNQVRTLSINGQYYGTGNAWNIDTTTLPDGMVSFEIQTEDRYNQVANLPFSVEVDNSGPEILVKTNIFSQMQNQSLQIKIQDAISEPVSLGVNGEFYLLSDGQASVAVETHTEVQYLNVTGLDGLGNVTRRVVPVVPFPADGMILAGEQVLIDASESVYAFEAMLDTTYLTNTGSTGQLVVDTSDIAPGLYTMTVTGNSETGEISSIEVPVEVEGR